MSSDGQEAKRTAHGMPTLVGASDPAPGSATLPASREEMMRHFRRVGGLALVAAATVLLSCGEKETLEDRVQRLRSRHEIYPVAATTVYDSEKKPTLLVDVQIANQGTEPLAQLTVLVKVRGRDGSDKLSERVTLDLTDFRPGIGERRSATIPGFELAEDDEVLVELEGNLPIDEIRSLPEYRDLAGSSPG